MLLSEPANQYKNQLLCISNFVFERNCNFVESFVCDLTVVFHRHLNGCRATRIIFQVGGLCGRKQNHFFWVLDVFVAASQHYISSIIGISCFLMLYFSTLSFVRWKVAVKVPFAELGNKFFSLLRVRLVFRIWCMVLFLPVFRSVMGVCKNSNGTVRVLRGITMF